MIFSIKFLIKIKLYSSFFLKLHFHSKKIIMRHFEKLCIALFVFIFSNAPAQIQDFDLSDYKLPELKRQTLGFDFALSNRVDKSHYSTNYFEDIDEEMNNSAGFNSRVIHTYYYNSPYWQQDFYSSVNISGSYRDAKEDKKLVDETHRFNGGLSLYLVNRYYFQGNEGFFLGGTADVTYNYNYYKELNARDKTNRVMIYLPLSLGYGRIEQVQDARQAAYIYEALKNQGKTDAVKSSEELLEFARFISTIKNERFFDFRNKRIYELEQLDQYLKENGYVDEQDISYFATLSDLWSYGNTPIRSTGFRVEAFINPGYSLYETLYRGGFDDLYNMRAYVLKTGLEATYEKPLNLYWQHYINANVYWGSEKSRSRSGNYYQGKYIYPGVYLDLNHGVGYYPNTRTSINVFYGFSMVKHFDKTDVEENIGGFKAQNLTANLGVDLNYYISPQIRLSADLNMYYTVNNAKNEYGEVNYIPSDQPYFNIQYPTYQKSRFNYALSASLQYFLF